jgi:glycosyltransferase involved in cell wall biosynthesis
VPAYNESKYIEKSIKRIVGVLGAKKLTWELIIVDDGSTDGTLGVANKLRRVYKNLKVVGYENNRGKGAAILFGSSFAKGDYIAFIDADRDIDPRYLIFLLEAMNGTDIAILSKNHPQSKVKFPLYRKILSKGYYILVRILFSLPVSDTQVGCKIFKNQVIRKIKPFISTKRFVFDLELLAYSYELNYKIKEYAVVLNFSREKSRISVRNILRMLLETLFVLYKIKFDFHKNHDAFLSY